MGKKCCQSKKTTKTPQTKIQFASPKLILVLRHDGGGGSICVWAEGYGTTCESLWVDVAALPVLPWCWSLSDSAAVGAAGHEPCDKPWCCSTASPFSPTIPQSLGLHQPSLCQAPKSPVSSCPTLHALTLTCLCSFSRLSPCPSSSILTAQLLTSPLLSLFLTDLISVPPLREDSLPDSTCVSNIISSCNWIWPRGIFSQNGSDWHNALVNCVDLWHLFYSNGKYLNRNSSAGPSFFSSQKLFRWHTYIQEFFFLLSVLLVFSIVPIPQ